MCFFIFNVSLLFFFFFFFNDTATTEIYTLSLHDALPIYRRSQAPGPASCGVSTLVVHPEWCLGLSVDTPRSEEHTSELQSRGHLVCRLLLEKKKKSNKRHMRLIQL